MKQLIILAGIVALIVTACVETEPVSPIPEVSFRSLELESGMDPLGNPVMVGLLKFHFIDGDADFGLDTPIDSTLPDIFNYNVFLIPYEKIDTFYVEIEQDTNNPPPNYRVLRDTPLDRVGQNKTVQGEISISIFHYLLPESDTLRYDFYIVDRALNKSNVESTSDIGFR